MKLEVELTCPLGSKCEEARDGKIYRCAWFTELAGQNPQTGEEINERGCAMSWVPILLVENSRQNKSTTAAVESFRNEVVEAQDRTSKILTQKYLQNKLTE